MTVVCTGCGARFSPGFTMFLCLCPLCGGTLEQIIDVPAVREYIGILRPPWAPWQLTGAEPERPTVPWELTEDDHVILRVNKIRPD